MNKKTVVLLLAALFVARDVAAGKKGSSATRKTQAPSQATQGTPPDVAAANTMRTISALGAAIDHYSIDAGAYPTVDVGGLCATLVPKHLKACSTTDGWGTSLRYRATRSDFVIASAGADRSFEPETEGLLNAITGMTSKETHSFRSDIVFADGQFFRFPAQDSDADSLHTLAGFRQAWNAAQKGRNGAMLRTLTSDAVLEINSWSKHADFGDVFSGRNQIERGIGALQGRDLSIPARVEAVPTNRAELLPEIAARATYFARLDCGDLEVNSALNARVIVGYTPNGWKVFSIFLN